MITQRKEILSYTQLAVQNKTIAYLTDEEFKNSDFKEGIEKRKDYDRMEVWYTHRKKTHV